MNKKKFKQFAFLSPKFCLNDSIVNPSIFGLTE